MSLESDREEMTFGEQLRSLRAEYAPELLAETPWTPERQRDFQRRAAPLARRARMTVSHLELQMAARLVEDSRDE